MQLKLSTGYAIKIIMYIAMKNKKVSSAELGEYLCIHRSFVFKVCKKLNDGGLIKNEVGINGGFYLTLKPSQITIYNILTTIEDTLKINKCLEDENCCNNYTTENCPMKHFYNELQNLIENHLKNTTIDDLLNQSKKCDFKFIPKEKLYDIKKI